MCNAPDPTSNVFLVMRFQPYYTTQGCGRPGRGGHSRLQPLCTGAHRAGRLGAVGSGACAPGGHGRLPGHQRRSGTRVVSEESVGRAWVECQHLTHSLLLRLPVASSLSPCPAVQVLLRAGQAGLAAPREPAPSSGPPSSLSPHPHHGPSPGRPSRTGTVLYIAHSGRDAQDGDDDRRPGARRSGGG